MKKGFILGLLAVVTMITFMSFKKQPPLRLYSSSVCGMSSQSVAEQTGQYGVNLALNTYHATSARYVATYHLPPTEWCVVVEWEVGSVEASEADNIEKEISTKMAEFMAKKQAK